MLQWHRGSEQRQHALDTWTLKQLMATHSRIENTVPCLFSEESVNFKQVSMLFTGKSTTSRILGLLFGKRVFI